MKTYSALEWTVKEESVKGKCILRQLLGPDGERFETLRALSALGERIGLPYAGHSESVFVTSCIKHLLRCKRIPCDLEKICCAWCGDTENLEYDHDPPQARNTQPSPVQILCKECSNQKSAEDRHFDDTWRPYASVASFGSRTSTTAPGVR